MDRRTVRRIFLTSILGVAAATGTSTAFAAVTAGCTLYVDGDNGNNGNNGSTLAQAFRTPQKAEDWLEQQVALQSTYTVSGHTYTVYTLNSPQTVCIKARANNAPYDASNAQFANGTDNTTRPFPQTSDEAYTLQIKVSGTATNPLVFTAYDNTVFPVIRQSGYNAIQIEPTANYVTIRYLTLKGRAYEANTTIATSRYAGTSSPPDWTFYDGNCLYVKGNALDYTLTQYSRTAGVNEPVPLGVPTHITIDKNNVYACGGGGLASGGADYLTYSNNKVWDNAWWSLYGTSGITVNSAVDSSVYPGSPNQDTAAGSSLAKIKIVNNYVHDNREYVYWRAAPNGPAITDGEGIILDSNVNGTRKYKVGGATYTLAAYAGNFLVADNVVWNNGSAGIEVFETGNATVANNTLYHNRFYPSGYTTPSKLDSHPSSIATRPEISVGYITDTVNVVNNTIYGPTILPGHACGSTYVSGDPNNATYTCLPVEGKTKASDQTDPTNTLVNLFGNVYYELVVPVDDPSNHIWKVGTNSNNILNTDPRYVTQESGLTHPAYPAASSQTLPNFRILSGTPTSPAVNRETTVYPFTPTTDITGATQPGTSKLAGAYAVLQ